ncbi:zinc metalloprotease HtpX [Sporolactobacillus sp. CQH2019]|uniref:zinc metalloprotease HtpX n=1 Tax=Sporolactobacillus sp. CQH2019 TaxID=3023512 RepID=UPI0023680076|nr:zinc metalloprotease HtpX [Sporolactobacillus sp. CQH2019]MDD9149912.1 zinc metalloprotease HtpX [Sporolactobacillus sp. CQH2019]
MLYQQIQQNKRKTLALLVFFCLLVLAIGWAVGYFAGSDSIAGLVIAAVVLAFYIPVTFASAKAQVLGMSGAREIKEADNPMLFHIVDELSIVAHVPMPKIYVVDDPSPNAFATGMKPESSVIAFTTGLLEQLNREEIAGVAAHEFSHIRNYDIRLMTLCIALVGVIVIIADFGQRIFFWGGGRANKRDNSKSNPIMMVVALVLIILAPLAARFVQLAVSRNREYLADASAVEITRDPQGLINALTKIGSDTKGLKDVKEATASMYIASPFGRKRKKMNWFATHPPIENRIERLRQM